MTFRKYITKLEMLSNKASIKLWKNVFILLYFFIFIYICDDPSLKC